MKKEAKSTNGVYQRHSGWGFRFAYRDGDGKRHWVRRQGFATKADARKALAQAMSESVRTSSPTITVEAYLREWIRTYERSQSRKITTVKAKRGHVVSYLIPRIGSTRLTKLTPSMIANLYGDLLENGRVGKHGTGGLSPKTVRDIGGTLHKALKDAVRDGFLPRNPADDVELPRWNRPPMKAYDEAQALAFMQHATKDGDPLAALWFLLFGTGVRRGEIMGLRWSDVDLVAGTISISQTRVESGRVHVSTPKTPAARRVITLAPDAVTALAILKNAQEEAALRLGGWTSDLVATDLDGRAILPRTFTRRFQTLAKAAGLPVIRLHDARHTHATVLLDNGAPVHIVSRRLGHSSISTTVDVYVARMPAADRQAATAWQEIMSRAEKGHRKGHQPDETTPITPDYADETLTK